MDRKVVRSGLADGRRHDLDNPEDQCDRRNFVQQVSTVVTRDVVHANAPKISGG
jgi:hypothetical protein